MIKFVRLLSSNRSLLQILLILPLGAFPFLYSKVKTDLIPDTPFPTYEVKFHAAGRIAPEINERVTKPAEKIFNSLSGLVSLISETSDEVAKISIRFSNSISSDQSYLFVQEKLDQIKLELPRDVEKIDVKRLSMDRPADLEFQFRHPIPISKISALLKPSLDGVIRSSPHLSQGIRIEIVPDTKKLAHLGLSLTNITEALKVTGFSASIGRKDGIYFGIGDAYPKTQDLLLTVVAKKANHPVILSEVASIRALSEKGTANLKLWIDSEREDLSSIKDRIQKNIDTISITHPKRDLFIKHLYQPVTAFLLSILIQFGFFFIIFHTRPPLFSILLFNFSVGFHTLFWKAVFENSISLLDVHAALFCVFVGTTCWFILLARIQSYFLENYQIKKIPRSLEQVTLFSIGELMPTFALIGISFFLMSLPTLSTTLTLVSSEILSTLFWYGLPVLFILLISMPMLTDMAWLTKQRATPKANFSWELKKWEKAVGIFVILSLFFFSPYFYQHLRIGLTDESEKYIGETENIQLKWFRGYSSRLEYLAEGLDRSEIEKKGLRINKHNQNSAYDVWEFTPSGIQNLLSVSTKRFELTMKDLKEKKRFGSLNEYQDNIPLTFASPEFDFQDTSELFLPPNSTDSSPFAIKAIADRSIRIQPSHIVRNRMRQADIVEGGMQYSNGNIKTKMPNEFVPTQWTEFLLKELKKFDYMHSVCLLFFFIALAIYLNSFVRAFILFGFSLAPASALFGIKNLFPGSFHSDSLWLMFVVPWISLLLHLAISRAIDIERSRGHDRDPAVEEVRVQFAPMVGLSMLMFVFSLSSVSALESLNFFPSLMIWREGLFVAIMTAVFGWLTFRFLFPLLYLTAEEAIDNATLIFYKLFFLFRKKR